MRMRWRLLSNSTRGFWLKSAWFWPTIAAALTSKHHWLVIACDSCDTIIDLDLTVKLPIGIAWTTFGVALVLALEVEE